MHHLLSLRAAGHVLRYHAEPTIKRQTVAEHTWNVLRIWFELYGPPGPDVMVAILLHDVGELATGDLPHCFKRDNPDVKVIADAAEREAVLSMVHAATGSDGWTPPHVMEWDKLRIKICDLIEVAEFALDELVLGNRGIVGVFDNVERAILPLVAGDGCEHAHMRAALRRFDALAGSFRHLARSGVLTSKTR